MHILFLGPACPVIEACLAEKGHTFIRTEEALSHSWVGERRFDFGLSYRYQKIIRQDIIDYFGGKLINMHISFLPWNKGSYPNLWSYIENTPKGVTIHRIDAGIDTGDILLRREVPVDLETDTLRTSYNKLSLAVEELFVNNAEKLLENAIPAVAQSGRGSSHNVKDTQPYLQFITGPDLNIQLAEIMDKILGGGRGALSGNKSLSARPGIHYGGAA